MYLPNAYELSRINLNDVRKFYFSFIFVI